MSKTRKVTRLKRQLTKYSKALQEQKTLIDTVNQDVAIEIKFPDGSGVNYPSCLVKSIEFGPSVSDLCPKLTIKADLHQTNLKYWMPTTTS